MTTTRTAGRTEAMSKRKDAEALANWLSAAKVLLSSGEGRCEPPESLRLKGRALFNSTRDEIAAALVAGGLTADGAEVVLQDYLSALQGRAEYKASPRLMAHVAALTGAPLQAHAFLYSVGHNYRAYVEALEDYKARVSGPDADTGTREAYLKASGEYRGAFAWLILGDYVKAADFDGLEPGEVTAKLAEFVEVARRSEWIYYNILAEHCLGITDDETDNTAPLWLANIEALSAQIEAKAGELQRTGRKPRTAYLERADKDKTIRGFRAVAKVASEPVRVLYGQLTAPVGLTQAIEKYTELKTRKPAPEDCTAEKTAERLSTVTQLTVNKVFGGLWSLTDSEIGKEYGVTESDGDLVYKGNISAFAELCGYKDASAPEKAALWDALGVLSMEGLRIVTERTYKRYTGKKTKSGKRQYITLTEPWITQFMTYGYGAVTGDMTIRISGGLRKGGYVLQKAGKLHALEQLIHGSLPRSRARWQILTKENKTEDAFIDEIYGISEKRRDLEAKRDKAAERMTKIRTAAASTAPLLLKWLDGKEDSSAQRAAIEKGRARLSGKRLQFEAEAMISPEDSAEDREKKSAMWRELEATEKAAAEYLEALSAYGKAAEGLATLKEDERKNGPARRKELRAFFATTEKLGLLQPGGGQEHCYNPVTRTYKWKCGARFEGPEDQPEDEPGELTEG